LDSNVLNRNVNTWLNALALGYNNTSPQAYAARQADAYLGGPGGLLGAIANYNLSAVLLPTPVSLFNDCSATFINPCVSVRSWICSDCGITR